MRPFHIEKAVLSGYFKPIMIIEKMQESERKKILDYLLPYEKFSVNLFAQILNGAKSIYIVKGNFGEIHGVFDWYQGSSLHHCLPDVYGKNRHEMESAFVHFFNEMTMKYLFSISGEESGTLMLKSIIVKHFNKSPSTENEYYMMENERYDSAKDLKKMNKQLIVENAGTEEIEKIFILQEGFEKEEVVIEGHNFDRDLSFARFENFVEENAVYVGKIKNIPLCKLTVNAMGKNYALLAGIYTLPKYRKHGLAKAIVNSVTQKLLLADKKSVLFVKKSNIPAIKVYTDTGFKRFCDYRILYY